MLARRHIALLLVVAAGCGSAEPVQYAAPICINWKDDVQQLMANQCSSCHSGAAPAAGFDTASYVAVLAKAHAGDPSSPLLAAVGDATHGDVADALPTLKRWVVDCDVSYFDSSIHPGGWVDPTSSDFHGAAIANSGWNFSTCNGCHDQPAAPKCTTCHTEPGGPTGCTTCHGQPPETGAHLTHVLGGALGKKFDCSECHVKPTVYTDAGHLAPPPAKITFGALASANGAVPTWSHADARCSGVYCHGNAAPVWTGGASEAKCGTCHGLPPANHSPWQTTCTTCHTFDSTHHVDGNVMLGDGSGTCSACHGQPPATGAHQAHLGAHRLRGPIECHDCHAVPTSITAAGHIDHAPPAIVFPAGQPTLAAVGGFTPTWSDASGSCSNVYCHGAATARWSGTPAQAACGTCHGIPPADGNHSPALGLADCARCHAATVDAAGAIIVTGGQSKHINGVIDVQ